MDLGRLRQLVMDREGWQAAVYGVAKSQTRLSDWTELNWTNEVVVLEGANLETLQVNSEGNSWI